jgi:methylmalonyl-CoA mutase, N-terminal domain
MTEWRTSSGIPLKNHYGPQDVPDEYRQLSASAPGEPPFLRGAYPEMYRAQPWRIFQLSGFGNPEDENERIRFLLSHGSTGFIMEHDRNTADHLYDVDHPGVVARKEDVGLTGAVTFCIRDYETILDQIPLERTYGHPGGGVVQFEPFALSNYWTVARRRGLDLSRLAGTGQSDFNLTYLGCITKQQVPATVGLRFNLDLIEFCTEHMPRWVPVSIAGYNAADTGLNGYQELGALLANAVEYLEGVTKRGRFSVDELAKGVGGVSFRGSMDLFEDVAKIRASRKMWHDLLRKRYGVTDEKSLRLRIHTLTAGSAMTYQQPLNNLVRGTLMGYAAALAGTQSLGVSGYDEALSIPSEHAHQMSVRIQQILQYETGVTAVADPFGGSYFMESLTAEVEERAWQFFDEIQDQGGYIATLDSGWLHGKAAENQMEEAGHIASGEKVLVGVSKFTDDLSPYQIGGFEHVTDAWERAMERLEAVRRERDQRRATEALRELERACRSDDNIMPAMMDVAEAEVTMGEVGGLFRDVFGDWEVPIQF